MTTAVDCIRGLYAVADTGYLDDTRLVSAVEEVLRAGARAIQYRDKSSDPNMRMRQALRLRESCRAYRACFIVNDDVDLARMVGADGVHLGRDDMPLASARAALGGGVLIGVSCYGDLARAERAAAGGADYVAFGSFFASPTKPGASRVDLDILRAARARLSTPIVAIGGITPENGASLIAAGADALAVIAGLFAQPDVAAAAKRYTALFGATQP